LLNVPLARWAEAADAPGLGRLAGEVLLPGFSENLLASFLSLAGGPAPALAYRAVLHSFEWLSPILPRLPWAATAFIGVLGPALGLALAQRALQPRADGERGARGLPLPILGLAAVALLWFNVGLFGVQPTLVSGVSMEPALQAGDIVIVRQVPAEQIAVGDVIRFRHEGVHVVHRVVEIQETQEGWVFVTRGDANDVLDPPLTEDRVEGVVVAVIPKVGWVAIAARQLIGANR
jgi:signal peptidase